MAAAAVAGAAGRGWGGGGGGGARGEAEARAGSDPLPSIISRSRLRIKSISMVAEAYRRLTGLSNRTNKPSKCLVDVTAGNLFVGGTKAISVNHSSCLERHRKQATPSHPKNSKAKIIQVKHKQGIKIIVVCKVAI